MSIFSPYIALSPEASAEPTCFTGARQAGEGEGPRASHASTCSSLHKAFACCSKLDMTIMQHHLDAQLFAPNSYLLCALLFLGSTSAFVPFQAG